MLSKSFKPAKCKTSLKLAVARIKLLRNKREVQVKQMKGELAQLLESGQEQTARIRVEHVIREEKTMSAYELIELYCELIAARLPIIESQKSCPIDLKEAVASVIFASPRCADIPELMDIRKHFAAKYGKEFINSALEVRPDCGVSRLVVEKLSARAPDVGTKVKALTSIAQEHNVKWDSKAFEEQLQKPHDDLLNGPTSFASASNVPRESSTMKYSPATNQTNESSMKKMPQSVSANQQTTFGHFSETNTRSGTSVLSTSQSESKPSERRSGDGDLSNSYPREEDASSNRTAWKMEFQDATSAAQAAAESAERASMAARAAAELASRESMSRHNSSGSKGSPKLSTKYERPEELRVFLDEHVVDESADKERDEVKSPQRMKAKMPNLQQDEQMQRIPRTEEAATTFNNNHQTHRKAPTQSSSYSSQVHDNDDILDVNLHKVDMKDHSRVQRISSESEAREQNRWNVKYENVESSRENMNVSSSKEASSCHVTDDEKRWDSNIQKHENDGGTSRMDDREVAFGAMHRQSTLRGSFNVVFDSYGSDAEYDNSVFGRDRGNVLDLHLEEEPSTFQASKHPFSVDQNRSGSFANNKGQHLHLFTESQPGEHSESTTKVTSPSQYNDIVPPAFDESDGEGANGDDEVSNNTYKDAMRSNNFSHAQRQPTKSSYAVESPHESNQLYTGGRKEVKETNGNSAAYEQNTDADLFAANKSSRRSPESSLSANQPSSGSDKARPDYSSSDEEEPQPLHFTKRQPTVETEEAKGTAVHLSSKSSGASTELSDESGLGINFGKLTGGFKHRGFPRPPYLRGSAANPAHSSTQLSESIPITAKPIVPGLDERSAVEDTDQERYSRGLRPKSSADSQFDTSQGLAECCSTEGTPDRDGESSLRKTTITESVPVSTQEQYHQRSHRKGYVENTLNSQGTYSDPMSDQRSRYATNNRGYMSTTSPPRKQHSDVPPGIDKLTASLPDEAYASSEVLNPEPYHEKLRPKSNKDPSLMACLDSDTTGAKLDSNYAGGSRVKLSRRTRDVPSDSKSSSSRVTEPLPTVSYDAVTIQGKRSPEPVQSNSSVAQPSVADKQILSAREQSPKSQPGKMDNGVPMDAESTKSSTSTGESMSRESSFKKASHTHPKLPDYESLAAHFQSLRSNRR